jgi:acetylornithine/N-succinyldiaminopimelate aminotransferase
VSCFAPGDQGGTFSGHPVGCAVGLAVLRTLTGEGFLEHVQRAGAHLSAGLGSIAQSRAGAGVRGAGLLWALGLSAPVGPAVVKAALVEGLLINSPQPDLLRFMPALNVTLDEIDSMLALLERALRSVLGT